MGAGTMRRRGSGVPVGGGMEQIRMIADGDVDAVVALWEVSGLLRPWNDPHADIALARRAPGCALFVGREDETLVASVMCGADGHRGWLYYLAVQPARRGRGHGRTMVRHAERWLAVRGMPKVELMVREENTAVQDFYTTLGYEVEPRVVMSRWLAR